MEHCSQLTSLAGTVAVDIVCRDRVRRAAVGQDELRMELQ